MQKCLYLLCPTDCLETIINKAFQQENYFYTSLGNSFNADTKTINKIQCVVQKNHIRKIYFVLSSDNKIIKDALQHQYFSDMKGLQSLYSEISKQQEESAIIYKNSKQLFAVFSYFLNSKVQELQLKLTSISNQHIEIGAKIYDRTDNTFTPIYSNLMCLEKHQLN